MIVLLIFLRQVSGKEWRESTFNLWKYRFNEWFWNQDTGEGGYSFTFPRRECRDNSDKVRLNGNDSILSILKLGRKDLFFSNILG